MADINNKISNLAFIAACMVALMHVGRNYVVGSAVWYFYEITTQGLCRAAVPFYFLASGFFLARHMSEQGWWRREVIKRVRTLCVPFWIWNFAYLLLGVALGVVANMVAHRTMFYGLSWMCDVVPSVLGINLSWPHLGILWFVRMLFVLVLISPCLSKIVTSRYGLFVIGMLYLVFDWADIMRLNFAPCPGFFSWEGLFYFSIGIYIRKAKYEIPCPKAKSGVFLLAVAFLIGLLCLKIELVAKGISVWSPIKPFFIPAVLIVAWTLTPCTPWPRKITTSAFPIYLLHGFYINIISLVKIPLNDFARHILIYVVVVMLSIASTQILRKFMPRFSNLIFGGR